MQNQQLNEGLRPNDLQDMIENLISIDTHRSKMGEDKDVCVLSFTVKDRSPAKDLMEFLEKGYNFVLDSDVSSGENDQGEYFVFVELDRTPKLAEQIKELTYGVSKLTDIDTFKFRYYKDSQEHDLTEDSILAKVPTTPQMYEGMLNKVKTESIKKFFSRTLMDDLSLEGDVITIHKPFNQKIKLKLVSEDAEQAVSEGAVSVDNQSTAEIFWLTKVLGDYDISKIGDNFLFQNSNKTILLQRID